MKNLLYSLVPVALGIGLLFLPNLSHAEAQIKEVCKDRLDKAGKTKQDCKKIKIHKKLEGTAVPEKK